MCLNLNKRMTQIENRLGITFSGASSLNAKELSIVNLEYTMATFHGVEITYPSSGIAGKKDKNNQYIEIESIKLKDKSREYDSYYRIGVEFVGTQGYSNSMRFLVKQFDSDGFCVMENSLYFKTIKGERVKASSDFTLHDSARRVTIEISQ